VKKSGGSNVRMWRDECERDSKNLLSDKLLRSKGEITSTKLLLMYMLNKLSSASL